MKTVPLIVSMGLMLVVALPSMGISAEKEAAIVYHFIKEERGSGKKTNWDAWVNTRGTKFQSDQPSDSHNLDDSADSRRVTYFDGIRPGFYDIDPVNKTHRIFDKQMVERQKQIMKDMQAQFGMGQNLEMGAGGAGQANQDFMKAIQQAQEKMRQAKLNALKKAKKQGKLTPEAERESMQNMGGPSNIPEIKKTETTRKTKWGVATAYEEHSGGVLMKRHYVLPWSEVPYGAKPQMVNESMENFLQDIRKEFPQMNQMAATRPNLFSKGLPVITEEYSSNEIVSITTFTRAEKQEFSFGPSSESVEESMMSASSNRARRGGSGFSPMNQDTGSSDAMSRVQAPGTMPNVPQNAPQELPPDAAEALKQLQQLFGGQQ